MSDFYIIGRRYNNEKGLSEWAILDKRDGVVEWYDVASINKMLANGITFNNLRLIRDFEVDLRDGVVKLSCASVSKSISFPFSVGKSTLDTTELSSLLLAWRNRHNNVQGDKVCNYLRQANIGTCICCCSTHRADGETERERYLFDSKTLLIKVTNDLWFYRGSGNTFDYYVGDVKLATWVLDVAYCYGNCKKITITSRNEVGDYIA